ncbi:hypothetical protein PR003_g23022 [Phytophthora rubi]|uniref:Uncharacterized protein n=1 Tax=Phytophthora rubi TaxID=129364 RepID=A0A6A3KI87_9STRA|nr:hypothetical protein PR002_g22441 [Phytophthora rubi]KAE9007061.1 hypothetical protein PR001_g17059 [Phytophthora rubi]KAE9299353.1 hypothetical protein PR003_g23022 [Phytophthora rubi]
MVPALLRACAVTSLTAQALNRVGTKLRVHIKPRCNVRVAWSLYRSAVPTQ